MVKAGTVAAALVDDIKALTQQYKQKLQQDAANAVVFDTNA